jgi:hypothetical protein
MSTTTPILDLQARNVACWSGLHATCPSRDDSRGGTGGGSGVATMTTDEEEEEEDEEEEEKNSGYCS